VVGGNRNVYGICNYDYQSIVYMQGQAFVPLLNCVPEPALPGITGTDRIQCVPIP
jgi:hypothetical protein